MQLTGGYAPTPEQSTLAVVAHHPEAIYFGTTSGRLLPDGHKGRADDVIKGSPRDPSLFGEIDDAEPELEPELATTE
jgi:5-methyltetrahydrofolate--homocysteine methyltransferase